MAVKKADGDSYYTDSTVEKHIWDLVVSGSLSGNENMKVDNKMLNDFEEGKIGSTLRIYGWSKPCISLGYSQKLAKELDIKLCQELGWDVVRRITGGGIVFHNTEEVTYSLVTSLDSVVLPKGLVESCSFISKAIILGLEGIGVKAELSDTYNSILRSGWSGRNYQLPISLLQSIKVEEKRKKNSFSKVCFSQPVKYEIMVSGKKLVGNAQKRGKKVLFQHGSIPLQKNNSQIYKVLKDKEVKQDIDMKSTTIREVLKKKVNREKIISALVKGFEKGFGIKFK